MTLDYERYRFSVQLKKSLFSGKDGEDGEACFKACVECKWNKIQQWYYILFLKKEHILFLLLLLLCEIVAECRVKFSSEN